jgi:hypothetical protein
MRTPLRFGGPGALAPTPGQSPRPWPPRGQGVVEFLLQEFCHYAAKIWMSDHVVPQDADGLATFDFAVVAEAYRQHVSRGDVIPLDDGLDLAESYLLAQLISRQPLRCLLNSAMPPSSTQRMARVASVTPSNVMASVHRWFGSAQPASLTALVYDAGWDAGHCILLRAASADTQRVTYWDPWPLRSLLCAENNGSGVSAELVEDGSNIFWSVDQRLLAKVIYAIFITE